MIKKNSKKTKVARDRVVKVRKWRKKDIPGILRCHQAAYSDYSFDELYEERNCRLQLEAFPDGQYLVEVDGEIAAYATSLIVQLDDDAKRYKYSEITGDETFSTHAPYGDTLYAADIAVHPNYRGQGLSKLLYKKRKNLIRRYNLRRMIAYGRIPSFHKYEGRMTAEEYIEKVKQGEIYDIALTAHVKAGYEVKGVLLDYMPDEKSFGHATLLEWNNTKFDAKKREVCANPISRTNRKVRVCSAQYLMRRISAWEEFEQTVEFFVDTASSYHSHFLVLPEYFTAQLVYLFEDAPFKNIVAELVKLNQDYVDMMCNFSKKYQIYIVGGSTPSMREGKLYNVSYLFTPSGKVFTQDKLHITPTERREWGVQPGEELKIFATPYGRIAIQICYDIEFPEVSRLLALSGVEIIFVPFSTDEKRAYTRVDATARARAIENYIYVVTSGNVGNLPTIKNYLINYGQSSIYTPSDFAFPVDAIAGKTDPNVETVVIADLDLETLAQQRELGSVRPFFDRRPDLYNLKERVAMNVEKVD